MNTERFGLTERARVHAALGDPVRLAIVDTLISGDAAPGELGDGLDLLTNLVAHHLRVLEDAGLAPTGWRTAHLDEVVRRDDLLIAVCDNAHEHLTREHLARESRLHWSVPDPALLDTNAAFEAAYADLADRIDRLAPALSPARAPAPAGKTTRSQL